MIGNEGDCRSDQRNSSKLGKNFDFEDHVPFNSLVSSTGDYSAKYAPHCILTNPRRADRVILQTYQTSVWAWPLYGGVPSQRGVAEKQDP